MVTHVVHQFELGILLWMIVLAVIGRGLMKNPAAAGAISKIIFGFFKK